ncbi:hypothetical protein CW751_05205 [Brumimicrobium salinarum]|uniref:Glycosyltransferase RgtA/B/C/D-like domain-containing protein n=1 Tax=Brumimicrobium salinarum TaxID=2058658 RepID=A0A2I0R4E6_9FLAO|nr:glycosyltransferase family 39 protein [Brumimicrobium salinarum]PKR81453.1 hypothetical protein CW751_05205 [Brumimicrobium salinarum]
MSTSVIRKYGLTIILALFSVFMIWQNVSQSKWREKKIFWSDVDVYHTYLTAAVVNKDPFFELKGMPEPRRYRTHTSPIGRSAVKTTMGVAIMALPFYYVGHLYALYDTNYLVDGYSEPYQLSVSLSSVFYTVFGLIFLFLFLRKTFNDSISLVTTLSICVGTNLYFYAVYETGMSHTSTFFLLSVLLYLIQNWLSRKSYWKSFFIGVVLGLIVLVRPINILFILPVILMFKSQNVNWTAYFKSLFLPVSHLLMIIAGGFIILLPQLIFWKVQTGSFLYYSYSDEGFFWLKPHVWKGLFSFRKGWFIYTPLMLFALFGMVRLYKIQKMYFWALVLFLPLFLYVTFSWWCWWYGGGFSARTLVDILPFMALPLAALLTWIMKKSLRALILIIPLVLIYVNQYQSWQYSKGIIHYEGMTWEGYKTIFLKHYTPDEYWQQLRRPDYKNSRRYGEEKEIRKYE